MATIKAEIYRHACDLLATVTQSDTGESEAATRLAARPVDSASEEGPGDRVEANRPLLLAPLPTSVRIVSGPTATVPMEIEGIAKSDSAHADASAPHRHS